MEFTTAGKAHTCRFNSAHKIAKGDQRLTIKDDGDKHHYCLACARSFLERDTERLKSFLATVVGE